MVTRLRSQLLFCVVLLFPLSTAGQLPTHVCPYERINECAVRNGPSASKTFDKFFYVHLSKTAGTLTHNVLHALNLLYQGSFFFQRDTDNVFQPKLDKDMYIGSIRNVCTWYYSNWEYESTKGCEMIARGHMGSLAVQSCKDATTHHMFLQWIRSMTHNGVGWATVSFWQRYMLRPNSCPGVDAKQVPLKASLCMYEQAATQLREDALNNTLFIHRWVRQENYFEDLMSALHHYSKHRKNGPLNMTAVKRTVQESIDNFGKGKHFDGVVSTNIALKDPSRDTESIVLGSYFGSEDAPGYKLVREVDRFLFDLTGGCKIKMEHR